jgi:hypothetical protein
MAVVFFIKPGCWYCMHGIEIRGWNDLNRLSAGADSRVLISEVEMKSSKVLVFAGTTARAALTNVKVHKFCRA